MKNKALVFFPHNPWPPRSGAHRRCLEMLEGLKEIGCEVTLASSTLSSDTVWDNESVAGLKAHGVRDVHVHKASRADRDFREHLHELRKSGNKLSRPRQTFYYLRQLLKQRPPIVATWQGVKRNPPVDAIPNTPPGMRRWFARVVDQVKPDLIMMNYAHWDRLLNHRKLKSTLRIIDTLDIVSTNGQMQQAIADFLPDPLVAEMTPDEVLREDFFENVSIDDDGYEFTIFDRYDRTIAISEKEVDLIRRHTRHTKVSWIPVTLKPKYIDNTYSAEALFTVGPNLFNTQGYLYFVKKVLPRVLEKASSFQLNVTGKFPGNSPASSPGVTLTGFVLDLTPVYKAARFFICPVFGGTGQQIKIVEAMAHGLPVVALRFAAERSPVRHGENGLIANNADEFAEHTARMWNDPAMCRRLGNAARETVAAEFSQDRLTQVLEEILRR